MSLFKKNDLKSAFLGQLWTFFIQKQSFFAILGLFLLAQNVFAEGTKQLAPTANDRVYIRPAPNGFAYYNGPEDLRMKIHIANPNQEQVFLGFSRPTDSGVYPCSGSLANAFFRIKDPNGNVVFPTPGSNNGQILDGANSNISTYAQAVAGPSTIVGGSGYIPYTFNPDGLPAGDYYIEFSSSMGSTGSSTVNIEMFDITVATEGGNPTAIDGRVHSKIWSMYAPRIQCGCNDPTFGCFDRPFNGKFNVYVPQDSAVIEVDFANSGLQPAFFNIFFNSYGTSNTGDVNTDRMSLNSQQVFATEYPIFLNNPDENAYPSGTFGTYFEEPFFHTCNGQSGQNGAAVEFIASVTKEGQIEVLIDLENPGDFLFTPNSKDVTLAMKIEPQPGETGPFTGIIEWDGLDGLGNPVDLTQDLTYRMKYSQAIIHFPIYDAEYMLGGFNVQTIRPTPPPNAFQVYLYYDDTNIPDATGNGEPNVNLDGCAPPCHTWSNFNYGNVNTINTFFFGSEERTFLSEPAVCLAQAIDDEDSTTINVPVVIDVVDNDLGTNLDPTSVNTTGLMQPTNGTTSINPITGEITYIPNPGFVGVDMFEYEICDDNGLICSIATVTVTVTIPLTEIDCSDGFDNDGDGLIDCDDPDCEGNAACENPIIGIAKSNTSTINNGDGTFTVSYLLTIENFGNVDLSDLTIFDDIVTQYAGTNPNNFSTQNGTLAANSSWNGTANSNILAANQTLPVGASGTVSISFDMMPGMTQFIENSATAEGTSPDGMMTTDTSTDGTDPDGDDDDDDPDEEVPTITEFKENPAIGVAKNNTSTVNNGDGTYDVSFDFVIENFGDVNLSNLTLFDDVVGQFTGMNPTNFATQNGSLTANPSWDGSAASNILANNQTLNIGQSGTVSVSFTVTPAAVMTINNTATTGGTTPAGLTINDTSTAGTDADGDDNDDNPDESDPTPVDFLENPLIGVAKNTASTTNNGDGTYDVNFDFVIENFGDVNLTNLTLFDDIFGQFGGMNPTNFTATSGTLTANTGWNGTATSNILAPGQSLDIAATGTVSVSFTITPGMTTSAMNIATAGGTSPSGDTATDTSTSGTDPDGTDGDDDPDEMTPTTVPFNENPSLTIEKSNPSFEPLGNDIYTLTYQFSIENTGDIQLNDLEVFDDILTQFASYNPTNLMAIDGSLLANNSWTGNGASNVLQNGQSLVVGATGTMSISFDVTLEDEMTLTNLVIVSTTTPSGTNLTENDTNVYEFAPPFCPTLSISLENATICGNESTNITLVAEPNSGDIGIFYTIDNELDSTALYMAGHGGATMLTTIAGSAAGINATFSSDALANNGTAAVTYYIYAILNDGNPNISPACNVVAVDEITVNPTPNVTATAGGPYCENENVQLFITGLKPGETVQWNGPNGFNSTEQNPTIISSTVANDGIYTAVITNTFGCTFTSNELDIQVTEMPDAPTVSNDSPVCSNGGTSDVILTANTTAAGTINWFDENNTLIGSGAMFTLENVTAADAGNYYAIIDNGSCPSNPSATTEVIVDEIPAGQTASVGNDVSNCNTQTTVNLSANTPAIGSGMWSQDAGNPAGAMIANVNDPNTLVTGLTAGNYIFTWSLSNGACINYSTADMTVTVASAISTPTISGDMMVCEGQTLELTATGANAGETYEWTGPNGFTATTPSISITPVMLNNAGDYQVKIVNAAGCESEFSAPANVVVSPQPAQPILFGNPTCQGEPIELQTGSTGTTFEWFGPGAVTPTVTTAVNNVSIPSTNAGYQSGDWRVRITDGNGCQTELSNPYNVVINPRPNAPTASYNDPICAGDDLQLMATTVNGATYQWTGPNGYSSLQQNPTIFNASTTANGQYEVVAIIDGCASNPGMVDVMISESPTVNPISNGGDCGGNIELFANGTGGTGQLSYVWTGPNSFASSDMNPVIINPSAANEGTYTVLVMDDNGCSSTETTEVSLSGGSTVQPEISSNSPLCDGENLTLSTAQYSGLSVSYEWSGPNGTSTANGDYPNASSITIPNATISNAGDYTVFVNVDGCGSNTSAAHFVTVNNLPTGNITTDLVGNCVDGQTDVTLLANPANGVTPYSFIWNGPNGFASNAQNPVIDNATEAHSGTYTVMIQDGNGCQAALSTIDLNFANQPTMPMIASPQMACAGESVELTVTNPDATVTYAWTFNGNPIANNDSPTLVIDNAMAANSGTYEVTASKSDCAMTSATVELTVSTALNMNLADQDFGCTNGATNVTIASNISGGIPPYTYAWTGPNGFTSTQATPTIVNADASDSGTYNVVVTDDNGCSSAMISAVMTIKDALDQPVFAPVDNTCEGENITLAIQQYNGTNVVYVWTFNNNTISNNSNVLVLNNATAANSGTYEVSVNVDGCSAPATASFDLTVNEGVNATVANQNLTCIENSTDLTLTANITSGIAPFTYVWSGPNGFTSNAASPVITNVNTDNAGTYQVIITDDNGCQSATTTAVIQITEAPDAPNLTASGNVCEGGVVMLSTQSYTGSNVTYNWTKNGDPIANNSNILNINPATTDDSGDYAVSVTVDGCTAAPSSLVNVSIFENPTITIAAVNAQNCTDGSQSITLDATPNGGSGVYTYAWSGPNGFTSTVQDPMLNNINSNMAGTYTVEIFDNNGCQGATASTTVDITDAPDQPQITSSNPNACAGEEVILSVEAAAGANVEYAWLLNNVQLSNNANQLVISSATTADAGTYEVVLLIDGCSAKSETFDQAVFAQPELTIFPVNDLMCADGTTDLTIQTEVSTGTAPFTFIWTGPNGFSSIEQNPVIPNATSADAGNYQVIFTDANGCASTAESVTINISDGIEQPMIVTSNAGVCEGESLTLSVSPYAGTNVTYSWSKNGNPIQNDGNELTFAAVSTTDNGNYNLTVTVDGCANFANTFSLEISEKPQVTATSLNGTNYECADGTEDLNLMANVTEGTAPYTFSWTGPNGFASSIQNPTIAGITEADAGTYQVVVSDGNNCSSDMAAIEIVITDGIAQPQIMSSNTSGNANTCEGEDLTLSVNAYSGASVTYAWTLNGTAISNNTNELIIQNAMTTDAGDFAVTVTVDGCQATSANFPVAIFGEPMISIADLPDLTCTNGAQNLTVDATITNGSGNYSYAWTGPTGFQAETEDLNFQNATSEINGTYTLIVTDATGCISQSASVQINVQDGINEPIISATGPVCEGGEVTLEVTEYQGQNVNYAWTLNGEPLAISGHQYPIQNATLADAGDYEVTVSVNNCSATSEAFALTIFGAPSVSIESVDEIPCADGTQDVTLTTTVTGGIPPYIYAWEGPNGFSSTIASPTLSNVSSLQSGTYTVTVTDENDCGANAVSVEVVIGNGIDQPVIVSNTGNVCAGESTLLSVQNYTGTDVTFEWYLNNTLLSTNTTQHFINAATTADAGNYRVVVTVNDCDASSEEFILDIFESPQVLIEAIDPIACSDGTQDVTLQTTISTGTAPFIYEWSGPNGFASTVANPTLIDVEEADAGTYLLTVMDANNCAAATTSVDLVVSDGLDQPQITSDGNIACAGESRTLTVSAYTGANVSYEWFKNGTSIGNNSNELNFAPTTADDSGTYEVIVTVDNCSSTSDAYTFTVNTAVTATISLVDGAPDLNCTSGTDDIQLVVDLTGGTAPFTYEWTGPNGFNSTLENPTLDNINSNNTGTYNLVVTDANNCASQTASFELNITDAPDQPQITSSGATCEGGSASIAVQNYNGANVNYEWTLNGVVLPNNSNELIFNPANAANSGNYQVTVTVDGCSNSSDVFNLEIFANPTVSINEIDPINCTDGTDDVTFISNVTGGSGTYTYAWTGPNGFVATSANPTISGVNADDAGTYLLTVTDDNNCAGATASVELEITGVGNQPVITSSGPTCEGGTVTLTVETAAGANVSYQWSRNGVNFINNSNELVLNPVTAADAGSYQVAVTADGCTATSDNFNVEVYETPTASISFNQPPTCTSGNATLILNSNVVDGEAPFTYAWTGPNGYTSFEDNPILPNVNSSMSGVYNLTVSDANGCESATASANVTITDAPDQPVIVSSGPVCEGGMVMLSVSEYQGANVEYVWTLNGENLNNNSNQLILNPATTADAGDYMVTVMVGDCFSDAESYALAIYNEPTVTIADVPTFACTDGTEDLTFSVNVSGGQTPYTYNWTGPNGYVSTELAPTIEEVNESDAGTYILTVSDANGCVSDAASVAVEVVENVDQPTITSSGPVCEGDQVTLSTTAYQGSNVTYNWTKNGAALNINNPQIILNPATAADSGNYQVEVTVNNCSNTSAITDVEVYGKPTASIANLPNFECTDGTEDVTLNATVSGGSGIYSYAWTGPNGFAAIVQDPGLDNISAENAGIYFLTVTDNNGCESTTASVELVITDALDQPTISSTGPTCEGESFILSTTPITGINASYQWYFEGNPIGNDSPELIIDPATEANNGEYSVQISTASCDATSALFFQAVGQKSTVTFTDTPPMNCVSSGQTVTLNPVVSGGSGNYTYDWIGPNGFTSALENPTIQATTANAGSYTVVVTDNNGCAADAATIEVFVTESIDQPTISSTGAACEGEMVVISTENYQGANVTYAWTLNGNPIANNTNQIILSPATTDNSGDYAVTVTVDGCSATSNNFNQTIYDEPVASISPFEGSTCINGSENITLESTVTGGDGNYTYSWTGPNGFSSAGEDAFLGNINESNTGTYTLVVTDGNGCESNAVSLPIIISEAPDQPVITVEADACEGGAATLSVVAYMGSNVTYIWRKDGVQIPNNTNVLTINPATTADNGEYTVEVQVDDCQTTSNPIMLNIFGVPMVEIDEYEPIECSSGNDDITLNATVSGGSGNYSYEWNGPNGFQSFAENPTISSADASVSGTYSLSVTDSNGCASDAVSTEIFITNGIDQPVIDYDGAVCQGGAVTLSVPQYAGSNVTYTWYKDSVALTVTTNQIVFNPIMADDAGAYFVTVQSDDCASSSNPVQVEIYEEPTVEIAEIPTVQCVDGTLDVVLDATVTNGTAPFTYLWEGPGYFEVTEDALLMNVTAANSGTYTLTVTDANGCESDLAVINVNFVDQIPQPVISSNSPVCSGELIELSVPAYTGTMVEYIWTLEGQPVGENSPVLFITNATLADAGKYQVEVISDGCSSISAEHEVVVFENPTVAVTTGPSAFCTSGQDSLVINSTVTGGVAPFTYEWVGPNGFFSVNANPVLQNVNDDMDGSYTVFVTDGNGCQSNAFTIEIDIEEGIAEPVITSTGQSCDGDEFTLSVPAYTGQNVTYEWSTPNGITTNISGLNSNEIIINPVTADYEGIYTITVTVDGCTNTSDEFDFFILDEPTANPALANNNAICEGGDLNLLANATGNGTLTYAWSGPNGFQSNVPNPTINEVDESYEGEYLLVVTNQQGCSTTAILTINNIAPAPNAPTLTTNAPICDGEDLILNTSAVGDMFAWVGPLGDSPSTLQLPGLMTVEGTTTLPASFEAYMGGEWHVQVKDGNGCWSELSAPVTVEINEIPQAIATNGGAICAGGDAQLFANDITNATYEWYIAGENTIISTQQNPIISNVIEDTVFELLVTLNGCSSEAVSSTLVTVSAEPEAQPEAAYFLNSDCSPSDLQLTANMTTAGDFEFNWSGPNGFTSNLENPVIANATEAANGVYELTISNGNGCEAIYGTNVVSIIPDEVAQPIITASNVACIGETLTLTTTQYGGSDVDYVWLLGTTIVGSSSNNQFVINEVSNADEGDYTVMVQVDGCVLTSNIITIALLQQPTAAPSYVLGGGACEGGTLQLSVNSGNVSGNVTYDWTGPNGFTSNAPNPFISETAATNNGTYTVIVTNSNGCSTTESFDIVEISAMPDMPVASSNSPVCEGGQIMLTVSQPSPGTPIYVWYNGLGEVIGNGQTITLTEGSPEAVSPYSVKLAQNGCESDLSAPVSVTTEALATPMLTVDDNVICEGQPLILNTTAAASNNATYTWYLDGVFQGSTSNPTFIVNSPTTANTGIYTVQVNANDCESGVSNAVSVSVFGATAVPVTANTTDASNPACDGSAVILTTPFIAGANYTWFGPNGYTSTNFNPVLTDVSADEAGQYYVIVEVEGCATAVSATTTVYVQPALPVALIANDGPYCEGDSATLSILNPIELNPTDTVTYEWFNATTMVSIGTSDTTFLGIANVEENLSGDYYVVMTLNGCTAAASEPTALTVAALPQNGVADAGEDTELCASLEATLAADLPAGASGMWTSPTGATIMNPTEANSEIMDLQVGDNVFVWTLSQGGCLDYATDTVVYNVALVPADIAFAGADENLCGRSTITLDATIPTQATGTWTQPIEQTDAGISIEELNNPNTPISGLEPGEYTFYWSLTEGGCEGYSADTVVINIMDGPMNNAYIGKDEFYACGEEEFTLTAEAPSEGTGIWTSNTDALIVNPTSPTTLVADLAVGNNVFYWTLSAPDCPDYSVDSAFIFVHDEIQGEPEFYDIAFNETLFDFNVLDNDFFGNVDNYSFEVITRPTYGVAIPLEEEGAFDYIPNSNYFGFDTMQYVICNLDCPNACDTVTVSFLIGGTSEADDCFAPNLITPNGDGMNDALMFPCLAGGNFPNNNIMIFNRWGDKVYETRPYNNDWMGTYKGQPLPAGSYYYILMLEAGETPLTGFFTVVR